MLITLSLQVVSSQNTALADVGTPIARSYDGHPWEVATTGPTAQSVSLTGTAGAQSINLPTPAPGRFYRLDSSVMSGPGSSAAVGERLASRFLMQGTFGPTLTNLRNLTTGMGSLPMYAARLATFTRSQADEFLEVYKQVVPECVEMVNELSRGPFVALEVTGAGAVQRVRDLCGPRDIEVAKRVRAASLRAKFGASAGASGVHCTDLVQDAPLETEFVFQLTA
jgi:nucleoside diphosphate kinase